jgi:serine protease Do
VVGVNTAIIPYAQGIGFATPVNEVIRCVEQIEKHGTMVNPWIGISGVTATRRIADFYGLSADSGFIVTGVTRHERALGASAKRLRPPYSGARKESMP